MNKTTKPLNKKLVRESNYKSIKSLNSSTLKKPLYSDTFKINEIMNRAIVNMNENIHKNLTNIINESTRKINANYSEVIKNSFAKLDLSTQNIFKELSNSIQKINVSLINEETKKILDRLALEYSGDALIKKVNAVKTWGNYGWALYSELDMWSILNPPKNQIEADEYMIEIFQGEFPIEILNEIKDNVFIREDYIDDIILLFENKRYSSCIMVAVSSIERILLNQMHSDIKNGKSYGISNKRFNKVSLLKTEEFEEYALTYLIVQNLIVLIEKLFSQYGRDWVSEPDFVARDYISHGMSNIKWTEIDAVKICLLLVEFSNWSNIFNEEKN